MGEISLRSRGPATAAVRVFILLILLVLPFFFLQFRQARPAAGAADAAVKVERKTLTQSLRLNGTTQASRSFVVFAPRLEGAQVGSMVITKLAPAGTHVAQSDLLVEFDPQAQTKD